MIDKTKIKQYRRRQEGIKAEVMVNIRITKAMSEWLKKGEISPTGLFLEAVKEVGYQEKPTK